MNLGNPDSVLGLLRRSDAGTSLGRAPVQPFVYTAPGRMGPRAAGKRPGASAPPLAGQCSPISSSPIVLAVRVASTIFDIGPATTPRACTVDGTGSNCTAP